MEYLIDKNQLFITSLGIIMGLWAVSVDECPAFFGFVIVQA